MTWAPWYVGLEEQTPYGDTLSYRLANRFLADCAVVEDWGTGKGWFKTLRPDAIGIDGTQTPFSDIVSDLRTYTSVADGILLRHVLEHNHDWLQILHNAVSSAQRKLCIILFTPCGPETKEIAFTEQLGVPDISFRLYDILDAIPNADIEVRSLVTGTQYGEETLIEAAVCR